MTHAFSDQGIILHQVRFGEADKFVKILTAKHGLIDCLAKGARRLTSRKAPHLDSLNLIKFQTGRGETPYLVQVESLESFAQIKTDLKKTRTALYLSEILLYVLPENQPDEVLFGRFHRFLSDLAAAGDDYRALAVVFQTDLIRHLGFPPAVNDEPQQLIGYFERLIDRPLASRRFKIG